MKSSAVLSVVSCLAAGSVFAATWYVVPIRSRDDPDNYRYSIQEGVNAASDGDTILVEAFRWILSQTIVVTNHLTIRSLHGPQQTIVDGNNAVPCFNLGGTATTIDGFTITRGYGGGIDSAPFGPALLLNSIVASNQLGIAGGMRGGTAINCLFLGNSRGEWAAGMSHGTAINCTFARNHNSVGFGAMLQGTAYNSIFFENDPGKYLPETNLFYSSGPSVFTTNNGNIRGNPLFVDARANDFRLQTNSPCIDSGSNDYAQGAYDLIGNPRIFNGRVDMGTYEYVDSDRDGLRDEDEIHVHGTDSANPDTDGDGFDDGFEVGVGMNPLVPDEALAAYVQQHSQRFNLYPSNAVLDVAVGQLLLDATNGALSLRLQLQQTTNLETWTPIGAPLEWNAAVPLPAQYFRIRSTPN